MISIGNEKELVERVVAKLDSAPVECDGFVRLASTALATLGIEHQVYVGSLEGPAGNIPLHFWILWRGQIIDCRAQMWLGSDAPYGIFEEVEGWSYEGVKTTLEPLPDGIFYLLANITLKDVIDE